MDPCSDSERTESLSHEEVPGADVEGEEVMSALPNPVNIIQDSKMKGPEPLEVVPLRMLPYGGNEPVPFVQYEIDGLRDQNVPIKEQSFHVGKQEVQIPPWLKLHAAYKEGDWKAFIDTRVDGRRKDRTYEHRMYRHKFRSKPDVESFLNSGTGDMFKGRKLQKKKIANPDGHGAGTINKSSRGKNAANDANEKVSGGASPSTKPDMTPAFIFM